MIRKARTVPEALAQAAKIAIPGSALALMLAGMAGSGQALGLRGLGVGKMGGAAPTYADKVLGYGPTAYWPLWETSGLVAQCLVNAAQNGTYSSDVSTWPVGPGIGDGNTAPIFDGANDYINAFSAALQAAWPGSEGAYMGWARVFNAAVWADGTHRYVFYTVDATDWQEYVGFRKENANGFRWRYGAGGVLESITDWGMAGITSWMHLALTWSAADDEVKAYLNGAQDGLTQTVLGAWAGTLDEAWIGSINGTPALSWHGPLAHHCVLPYAATPAQIADLAVV